MAKKTATKKTAPKKTTATKLATPAAKHSVRATAAKPARVPKDAPVTPQAATPTTNTAASRMTCLDAAHAVLTRLDKPMRIREIMEQMVDRELWTSPGGSTPDATLTSAIIRDIAKRGEASRFKRVDRGYYAARGQ